MNLQERIVSYINSNTPVEVGNLKLSIQDLKINMPDMSIGNQLVMRYSNEGSLEGTIRGKLVVTDSDGNIVSRGAETTITKFPALTERGTYLINGTDKTIQNQMRLKPGCYTTKDRDKGVIKTSFMFARKPSARYVPIINLMIVQGTSPEFKVEVKASKKFNCNIVNFLWILGFTDMEMKKALGDGAFASMILSKYNSKKMAKSPKELLRVLAGMDTNALSDAQATMKLWEFFNDNATFDSEVVESTLGVKVDVLSKDIIFKAVQKASSVYDGTLEQDVKDDLKYKDVYSSTDLLFDKFVDDFNFFITSSTTKMANNPKPNANDFRGLIKVGTSIKTFMSESDLVQTPEETNPLFMEALGRKISQFGEGGMASSSAMKEVNARNLTMSAVNKLDPIETPESGNIGLVQHLTDGVRIDGKTIKVKLFRVNNGVATKGVPVELTPIQEEKSVVAFYNTKYLRDEGGRIIFTKPQVPCRYMGKNQTFPISQVQYVDTNSNNVLGTAANMIPFVMHNDGARALMGANMQKQAINILNKEKPLVSTLADKDSGLTYEEKVGKEHGKPIHSSVDGTVFSIKENNITIKGNDGKMYNHPYHFYYPLNQSFINNELKVKAGDRVKKGDLLAEGWQTKDGSLALGLNARIAYLPYDGYNYEDGIVISKSFAKRMTTEEMDDFEVTISANAIGGVGSNALSEIKKYTTDSYLSKLDKDGIIKVGEYVRAGNVIAAMVVPVDQSGSSAMDRIMASDKDLKHKLKPIAIDANSYVEGKVVRITKIDNPDSFTKQKLILTLVKNKPMKQGDKISGRHGNKGTVTKILDDELMPTAEDGKTIDVAFSPLAVPSRKNLGQVFEVNAGLIAEKTGKQFKVDNFNHEEKDRVLKELEKIGYKDGKMKVTYKKEDENGKLVNIEVENPVTVGNMYIMKLKHKADDKIQSRSNIETHLSKKENMPSKVLGASSGERHNPQSMGEMEMRALQGHGAVWNLLESTTIKSDGGGDQLKRIAMFKALSTGNLDNADLNASTTPESLKVLTDNLKALGLKVKPMYNSKEVDSLDKPFNSIGIAPLKTSEFIKAVGEDKEVNVHNDFFNARSLYGDSDASQSKKRAEIKGGLVDPEIFGEANEDESRDKWGFIKLSTPMPNPILMQDSSYNPYSLLTGIKNKDLKALMNGSAVVIGNDKDFMKTVSPELPANIKNEYLEEYKKSLELLGVKPGDIVSSSTVDKEITTKGLSVPVKTGSEFLLETLSTIDAEEGLKQAELELAESKGVDNIDKAYKKVRAFKNLVDNEMKPTDLLMTCVPVPPLHLRPISIDKESKRLITSDLNKLYSGIIQENNVIKSGSTLNADGFAELSASGLTPKDAAKRVGNIYNSLTNLSGHTIGKDPQTKNELLGFKTEIGGKNGVIRGKLLSKRLDFSGRSVIGVDPNLKLNEVGLPMDMAKQMYKPFAIKELVDRGYAANDKEAKDMLKKSTPQVKEVLQAIGNDRPIIINRQPSLHKFSIQALKPIIKDTEDGSVVRSMQLNPLVVAGFNADFDGDTMAAHVPVSEKAKEEAKKLMLPSQNLINPTDGRLVIELRHEMLLGLYQLTNKWDKPTGKVKNYMTLKELKNDYLFGRINATQRVKVPIYHQETTAGQAIFNWMIPDKIANLNINVKRDFKKVWGKKEVSKFFAELYRASEATGFKLMTTQQISNMMDAFKDIGFKASTRSGVSIGTNDFVEIKEITDAIAKADKSGRSIEEWSKLEGEIEDKLKKGILPSDNPLQIMMESGARANAGQIRRMMTTVGVGRDVTKSLVKPIKESHFEGISAEDFFTMGYDSRKGMYDRAVSTSVPGAMSRDVWSAVQDIIVKEVDCKTKEYITVRLSDKESIKGRFCGADVRNKDGVVICKRNQIITNEIYEKAFRDDSISAMPVRSPLRCKTTRGVCQKCYGCMPGTTQPVKIGSPIGVLASQAVGEPLTQMTMNTFHGGGTSSSATLGIPRVQNILNLGKDKKNGAVIAENAGTVKEIKNTPTSLDIIVDKKTYKIAKDIDGKLPTVKVKVGDIIKPGDFLTVGDKNDVMIYMDDDKASIVLTNADPKNLLKQKAKAIGQDEALNYTQDYLTDSMQYAFKKSDAVFDRRHMETIVSKLTENAIVIDSGDSKFMKGQTMDVAAIQKWNAENSVPYAAKVVSVLNAVNVVDREAAENIKGDDGKVIIKKGELITKDMLPMLVSLKNKNIKVMPKLIQYEMKLAGKDSVDVMGHNNWLSNTAGRNVNRNLARGAAYGQVDKLQDPRARLMTGKLLNIGEGAEVPSQVRNTVGSRMLNFFGNNAAKLEAKYRKK